MAKFTGKTKLFDELTPDKITHKDTHTHTDNDNDSDVYVSDSDIKIKETKTKRIQILTYDKIVNRMDAYAKRHGLSRAEVFEQAVSEFLDKN